MPTPGSIIRVNPIVPVEPDEQDEPDEPGEPEDAEIDDEHPLPQAERHSRRTAAQKRLDYRAMAGYKKRAGHAALRDKEYQEEYALKQRCCYTTLKASHFASKDTIPKIYRATRYNSK